ncbi:Peptidase M12B ADAM/reprolysin [Trinorchestia longiramus]|nr:Peptidase M12B ADAM/reprolysin [Trinorchestia longiramus]
MTFLTWSQPLRRTLECRSKWQSLEYYPRWRQVFEYHSRWRLSLEYHPRWRGAHKPRPERKISLCLLHLILLFISNISVVAGESDFVKPHLTADELQLVFGTHSVTPEYEVVVPNFGSDSARRTRSVSDSSGLHQQQLLAESLRNSDPLHLSLDALGHKFTFKLVESAGLVSPAAALVHRYRNYTAVQSLVEKRNCLYTGHQQNTTIAISICSHMRGVIRSPTEELIIEPLPATAQRRHRRSLLDQTMPILVHRRGGATPCSSTQKEGDGDREYLLSRFQPESQSALFNRPIPRITDLGSGLSNSADHDLFLGGGGGPRQKLPSVIYVETAVFVDKDLARHMENYFPRDSQEQLVQVVLAMVNAVQLLYSEGSLGVEVHFIIKRLEILHEDPAGLHRPHDIDIYLTNFCRWQRDENPPGDDHPLHWDHALVLTGLDLYTVTSRGRLNSQVVGLAPVAGMCSSSSSCTVNEGRHFESVYVVAHEIGHNLGMRHDGVTAGNSCDPGEHLMSPTLGSGKISWSTCSRRYLEIFLSSDQSLCLRDAAEATTELDHRGSLLPGQRFPADMQCLLKHGPGSKHADTQDLEDICEDLHCRRDHYTWTSHPALEGTTCGALKWCVQGRCLKQSTRNRGNQKIPTSDRRPVTNSFFDSRRGESPPIANIDLIDPKSPVPPVLESIPSSDGSVRFKPDQSGPFTRPPDLFGHSGPIASITPVPPSALPPTGDGDWSECLSSCLYGTDGMLSSGSIGIQKSHRSCSTCRGQFRYRTCSAVRQCAAGSRRTIQEFADQACRALIVDNPRYSGLATTISPNGLSQCRVACAQVAGLGPDVSTTWYPDGTTCYRDSSAPAYCVAGVCKEFSCDLDSQFVSSGVHCLPVQIVTPGITVETDFWGPWNAGSSCRTSCIAGSRGIELVSRQCLRRETECKGLSKNIRLCSSDVQGCHVRQTVFQHATEVCRRFQREVSQLSGVGMQLSNTASDPDRACTVACQDLTLHYRFYRVNGREGWFPFGTDCSGGQPGRPKHCLNGKCLDFDVEGIPLQDSAVPTVGARSRSLDLQPVVEDAVEIQPLLPLRSGVTRSTPPPFYSFQEQQVMMHKQLINQHLSEQQTLLKAKALGSRAEEGPLRRFKRGVTVTSHRLPGSIDSQFLLTLVDQLNFSMTHGNDSSKSPLDTSTIDLANPIFADVGLNSSHSTVRHRWSLHSRLNDSRKESDVFTTSINKLIGDSRENGLENFSDHVEYETETSEPLSELADLLEPEDLTPPTGEILDLPVEDFWPKKPKGTAMLLGSPNRSEKLKANSTSSKGDSQEIISITRGRSIDSALSNEDSLAKSRDSLAADELHRAQAEHGVWDVKRTPCSVTCGEGLREVIVTCLPALALTSKGQPKTSPHNPRQDRKIARLPQTGYSKTIYGQPVPLYVDANAFPDAFTEGTRVYHLKRGSYDSDRRAPISTKNQDDIHRWYHIIIENPDSGDRSRNDLRRSRPIDIERRNNTRPDLDSARSSLFQDTKRRDPYRIRLPSPSFTSNSQLRNIVHRKRGRSIDSSATSTASEVRCAGPMPAVPGFQRCVLKVCPLENSNPSPVLSAWLTSLVAQSQRL